MILFDTDITHDPFIVILLFRIESLQYIFLLLTGIDSLFSPTTTDETPPLYTVNTIIYMQLKRINVTKAHCMHNVLYFCFILF